MKTKNYMTFKEAEQEIKRLDPNLSENSETFKVAALMLYGSLEAVFTNSTLQYMSGYDRKIVSNTVRHLKSEGIWKQGVVDGKQGQWKVFHSGWFDEDKGGVAFWLDVNRALGYITAMEKLAKGR